MSELPVILRTRELYTSIGKFTDRLPSLKRQTIGRRIEYTILELLELFIMAKTRPSPIRWFI
jgi:hypothetical protein